MFSPVITFVVAGIILAISGCQDGTEASRPGEAGSNTSGSSTSKAPASAAFPDETVDHTLMSVHDLESLTGATGLEPIRSMPSLNDNSGLIDNKKCLAVVAIGEKTVYAESGFTATRVLIAESSGDDFQHVEQSAVIFPSAEEAKQFFDKSQESWDGCVDVPVTLSYPGEEPAKWIANKVVSLPNPLIFQDMTNPDIPGWTCPHAMAVRQNLVVEAAICRNNATDQPQRIVEQMLKNAAK